MFGIEVTTTFHASHQLRLPGGGIEPLHAHDWHVTVRVQAGELDALETVMDFHVVEAALKKISSAWENQNLNDIEPFVVQRNPSAERVAERIAELLEPIVAEAGAKRVDLTEVRVTEAPGCVGIWNK